MTQLKDILYKVKLLSVHGATDIDINAIQFDSRKVEEGNVFIAVRGTQVDGHNFIDKATASGAKVIVCEDMPAELNEGLTYIQTDNSARALGIMASNFYGNPSSKLKLVAVTGTNGKTTTVTLLYKLLENWAIMLVYFLQCKIRLMNL